MQGSKYKRRMRTKRDRKERSKREGDRNPVMGWAEAKRQKWAIKQLIRKHNGCCALCGGRVELSEGSRQATVDHIIPVSRGGTDDITNLQLAHRDCNQARGCDHVVADLDLMPPMVRWLLENGAYLAGGQARHFKAYGKPKPESDWDVWVPIEKWRRCGAWVARAHRQGELELSVTGFGGLRVRPVESEDDAPWLDVWPDTFDGLVEHLKRYYPKREPVFYSIDSGFVGASGTYMEGPKDDG